VPKANTAGAASRMRKSDKRGETRQHQRQHQHRNQQQGVPIAASENMDAALVGGGPGWGHHTHGMSADRHWRKGAKAPRALPTRARHGIMVAMSPGGSMGKRKNP